MSIIGTIHEDVTTDVIGKIGSWQWLVTFISTVLMAPALFHQYEDIFMVNLQNVMCIPPDGASVVNSSVCSLILESNGTLEMVHCKKWHIKIMWIIWIKKSWLVFCNDKMMLLSTAMISRLGIVFGCIIFGLVSDSFGRKTSIIIGIYTSLCSEITLTLCDSEGWFRLFVFLKSLFGTVNLYMGLLLVCEIASNRWRSTLNTIVMTPRLLAMVCTVPLANAAPNIETNGCIDCLLFVSCIIVLRWYPESPQWLLFNRKIHKAEVTLKNAAEMNGFRFCGEFKIRPVNHRAYNCLDETTTCVGVLTTPNIRTLFFVTWFFWAIYYFLWSSLYIRDYNIERHDSFLLKVLCSVSLFSSVTIIASKKLALRYLLMMHVVLTGATIVSVVLLPKGIIHSMSSSIAISTGIIVHALILNITPRLFSINIRATVLGFCHAGGQTASIITYITFMFKSPNEVTYLVVVIIATILLSGLCFLLPNVDDRELPDVIMDMDFYSELSKPLRWATQKTNSPSLEEIELRIHSFGSSRTVPTRSNSETRIPARRIGLPNSTRRMTQYFQKKFGRLK